MFRDRDLAGERELPSNAADLMQDLGLKTLFDAMAAGDKFLFGVAENAILASLQKPEDILYRQGILADCMDNPATVREIYGIASEAIEREREIWGWLLNKYPEGTLCRAVEVLELFLGILKRLRGISDKQSAQFCSEGFQRFFAMLTRELDDEYLAAIEDHLHRLAFHSGVLMSAGLGQGNKGANYVLHKTPEGKETWMERIQAWVKEAIGRNGNNYVYEIADRDEAGFRALSELRDRGISDVAIALAKSTDHILTFFQMVRVELGFFIGCLNLYDQLVHKGEPVCLPEPLPAKKPMLASRALYDVCLSLNMAPRVVGNDLSADDKVLVIITGANGGGKSTLLRSVGVAQLMMQSGMFVPAEFYRSSVCHGTFTHFKREEDVTMKSGKLDEELHRMSEIVDMVSPNSLVLLNESFASTNEREGSEIARQIIRAFLEMDIKVLYVTHLFDLAESFYRTRTDAMLFLRAERLDDGRRTFRLVQGEPLPTSFGKDLYEQIFCVRQPEIPFT